MLYVLIIYKNNLQLFIHENKKLQAYPYDFFSISIDKFFLRYIKKHLLETWNTWKSRLR